LLKKDQAFEQEIVVRKGKGFIKISPVVKERVGIPTRV
jgi:hypothetical protein